MFLIVQFTGLLFASRIFSGATFIQQPNNNSIVPLSSLSSVFFLVAYIVVLGIIIAFLVKFYKGNKMFILVEAFAVFVSSFVFFLIAIGVLTNSLQTVLYGSIPNNELILVFAIAVCVIIAKNRWPRLRNSVAILSSIGVGLVFGLNFNFLQAIVFMFLISIYDFIAVFITKHMVVMGNAMANMNLAFLVGASEIEAVPRQSLSKKEMEFYSQYTIKFSERGEISKEIKRKDLFPVFTRRELGTGDLAIPLAVAISTHNIQIGMFIVLGATIGLLITISILRKYKRALPAIPPLLLGVMIGFGLYLLFGAK